MADVIVNPDGTDTPPDLSRMDVDEEYTVYYTSRRSGNEVDRGGVVTYVSEVDDGGHVIRLHDDRRDCYKHVFVTLTEGELSSGEDVVLAYSQTASATPPARDEPPRIGRVYTIQFESRRTSLLGIVDRVVREGSRGPVLMTDGGSTTTTDRPDDCNCADPDADLPCFACYLAGFDEPNPDRDERPMFPLHPTEEFFDG